LSNSNFRVRVRPTFLRTTPGCMQDREVLVLAGLRVVRTDPLGWV
jgi:hypothetical protein